ncbi:MAG: SUMF1/EgtB/PvdO family nonheme iron enzyme [Candidatus Kapabacteria bacterium]|jgi:formylglycine-generating enzyme required for sulfatase activity|nr:SUMF1/EgtB/PvdO family nonheme iron enzyme [Candidatus Kapabacteria bacterium]
MFKKYLSSLLLIVLSVVIFSSCGDESSPTETVDPDIDAVIGSVSPTTVSRGDELTIIGTKFGSQRDTNFVLFGDTQVPVLCYSGKTWNDTLITVKVPDFAVTGNVYVNVKGKKSNGIKVTIQIHAPEITSVDPTTLDPGDPIKIMGKHFADERGNSYVKIDSKKYQNADDYQFWCDTLIWLTSSVDAVSGKLSVVTSIAGNEVDIVFTEEEPEYEITSIVPAEGRAGDDITVRGNMFGETQTTDHKMLIKGSLFKIFKKWSDTEIIATLPLGAKTGGVYVWIDGVKTPEFPFTVLEERVPLMLNNLSSSSFPVASEITIFADSLGTLQNESFVLFNDIEVHDVLLWTDNKVKVVVPDDAVSGKLSVNIGGVISNSLNYTITTESTDPILTALDKNTAMINDFIGVYGKNLGAAQGASFIDFNGIQAVEYKSWSDKFILVKVPEGLTLGVCQVFVNVNGFETNTKEVEIVENTKPQPLFDMVLINSGSFEMGKEGDEEASPVHTVTISNDYYMGIHEITQSIWKQIIKGSNPFVKYEGDNNPATYISWGSACYFCNMLSIREGYDECYTLSGTYPDITVSACNFSADGYRLPTEAEWEYACRAGTTGDFSSNEATSTFAHTVATNPDKTLFPVGQLAPNPWGLYDMHGNAFEMCWDWMADYSAASVTDPKGPGSSYGKIRRGGSAFETADHAKSWKRAYVDAIGVEDKVSFRVVRIK